MKREDLYVRVFPEYDGFDKYIESLGGEPETLMKQAGIEILSQDSKIYFVPWAAQVRYFEIASEVLNEPYLGLKWAFKMPKDYRNSGPTLFLSSFATDFRHFADIAIEYQKVHTNGVAYSYEEYKDTAELIGYVDIHPLSPPCRQYCEHIMAGIAVMARRYIPDLKLSRVEMQYARPDDLTWYEKAFRCPVTFNAPRNLMVTEAVNLKLKPTKLATHIITPLLKGYLKLQMSRHSGTKNSMRASVTEILPGIMGNRRTDVESVAMALDIHPKKLQRLLKDEGVAYSDILDEVRKNLAERLLIESDISIERIAKMLDYASDRPFTAAMRRWFEMSPTAYRKAKRQ